MRQKRLLLTSWGRGHGHITRLEKIGRAFGDEGWIPMIYGHSNSMHVKRIVDAGWQYECYEPWLKLSTRGLIGIGLAFCQHLYLWIETSCAA